MGQGQIGVFLLDDHEIVRRGVRELLESEPDIRVVGEAGTAESAPARIPALRAGRGGAGASGYVLRQIRGTDLVGAVHTVAAGRSLLDPEAASGVMRRMREQAARSDPLAGLTGQERRILELIGEGLTNRQIGERMYLAEKTVKNYVSGLFAMLGMERRTQAAAYAARIFVEEDAAEGEHPAG